MRNSQTSQILLVGEMYSQLQAIIRALEAEDLACVCANDVAAALQQTSREPQVVVVGLGPGHSVFGFLHQLRFGQRMTIPVIILAGEPDLMECVAGLESGADDFIAAPFSVPELVARVKAMIRRISQYNRPAGTALGRLIIGNLQIDPPEHRASINGATIHLPRGEFRILCILARSVGKIVKTGELFQELWGWVPSKSRAVAVQVSCLRRKLVQAGFSGAIVTVLHVGYRLDA